MQLEELSNISDNLAMMPDPALQQFAQMHKQDPYMVSLALSESNRRKALRTASQGQAGATPQPKVVDAAIQGMRPTPVAAPMVAQTQLPENQGIARIPAPNMRHLADGGIAGFDESTNSPMSRENLDNMGNTGGMFNYAQDGGGVMRMAGGGMTGYMPGFNKTGSVNAAFEAALQKTLGYEGGYVEDDAGKGPSNFGINKSANPDVDVKNLTKEKARELYKKRYWDAIGGDALAAKDPALATVAFDTAVNMGVGKANQLVAASKGNPSTLLGMRQQHYDSLIKKDPEKFAPYAKSWKERVADLATSVIPSAEAGTLPQKQQAAAPADTSLAAQIPGYSPARSLAPGEKYAVPPPKEPGGFLSSDWFERQAENLGLSRDVGRNVSNTLNAPTPLAPVVGSVKSGSGIVSLGEKLGNKLGILQGPAGRMSAAEIAALRNEQGGIRALEAAQQATKEAQSAGATLEEQDYLRKMIEARQAKEAPSAAQKIAEASQLREAGDVATAQRLAQTGEQAQAAGRASSGVEALLPPQDAAPAANTAAGKIPFKGISGNEMERMQEANQAPMTRDDIVKAAEEVTPVKERKGFNNDDLLTLGLSLLASKSPNFMTALGEAGLATVAGKKEREKTERETAKSATELDYMKARTKEAEATAALIERGGKEKKMELEAEKMIQNHMADWAKSMEGKMGALGAEGTMARQREEDRVRTAIYASLGLKNIMPSTSASSGVGADPLGILGKR
jgi:hypothetical protein